MEVTADKQNNRVVGVDYARAIAAICVTILHVNGYVDLSRTSSDFSANSYVVYCFYKSFAIMAVHLFVIIGGYLMCQKQTIRASRVLNIYFSMLIITVFGLIPAFIFRYHISLYQVLTCLFPFSFRAYGFVSSYIVIILLSPYLNIVIHNISSASYSFLIVFLTICVCFFRRLNKDGRNHIWYYLSCFIWWEHSSGYIRKGFSA